MNTTQLLKTIKPQPKREWKIAVGAALRTRDSCILVTGEGTAYHSRNYGAHNCWIGIDYSTGREYEVFIARAQPVWDRNARMVYAADGRTPSRLVAIPCGEKNWAWHCSLVNEITLPE